MCKPKLRVRTLGEPPSLTTQSQPTSVRDERERKREQSPRRANNAYLHMHARESPAMVTRFARRDIALGLYAAVCDDHIFYCIVLVSNHFAALHSSHITRHVSLFIRDESQWSGFIRPLLASLMTLREHGKNHQVKEVAAWIHHHLPALIPR